MKKSHRFAILLFAVLTVLWFGGCDKKDSSPTDPGGVPNAGDTKEVTISGVVFTFAWIPAGSFQMGSPDNEQNRSSDEGPVHTVTFAQGFWMMTTEVTQKQWTAVMGSNPAHDYGLGDAYPIYNVSWYDIQIFEQKLGVGYGLPSESEWEYACRAGTSTRFYWGDDPSYSQIDSYAWYYGNNGNSGSATHPVGGKEANAWGFHDMSGNVWEWCEDDWRGSYLGAHNNSAPWVETPRGSSRALRGGSWNGTVNYCRSANRNRDNPGSNYNGFRIVCR